MDLKLLSKLETPRPSTISVSEKATAGTFPVIIKLRPGASEPTYVRVRSRFGPAILTADVHGVDLERLQGDDAVTSFSFGDRLARID